MEVRTEPGGPRPPRSPAAVPVSLWLALANLALHLATIGRYGYFRDELYYVACGERLAWGYVDHPPFVAVVARLGRALFGGSPAGLRLLPVVAGSAVVLLAGLLARELGGGRFAQALASLCTIAAPVFLFSFHILSMNVFDVLFWTLAAGIVVRIAKTGNPRLWLLFGAIAGVGLENKWSLLFFGAGIAAGLLLTPLRRHLLTPWPWLGGAVALALFLPHLLWEVRHGWPTLEFMANAREGKNVRLSPLAFLAEQVLLAHPLALPVWLAGLGWLFFSREGRPYRLLGWAYPAIFALLVAQSGKPYYLAPIYPLLYAAGAVAIGHFAARPGRGWLRPAVLGAVAAGGALTAPIALPVLPVETFVRYAAALGIQPSSGERHRLGRLPQHFADMHGWPEMVAAVAEAYGRIPQPERSRCAVFAQNYGEAGAIDLLGKRYGLPDALSAHNNYFLWGPRGATGECMLVLGDDEETLSEIFADVRLAGVFRCRDCMPYESDLSLHLCRRPKVPLARLWPRIKSYG